ncbi:hypothetical protein I316_02782 [Kwoniella heveanensis BCC8398]|uniref:Early meiotic induction protein 1 n=1 Tax=Kwoniella heveanensis BCC8398 TaxID=1296120 RepID=A0A1B9GXG7_9TREE|nr:hypothetical protein I316_02782 [Kwoniella heveanensis BCC8398]
MGWFFGSSSSSAAGTASNEASSSSSAGASGSSSLSSASSPTAATPVPTVNTFESVLSDEEKYQALQYPSTEEVPGCMRLLDEFLMCYALAPQLRSMYRHGEFRDCTWKWQDFKYCLSLKSEDEESRRQLWIKRRADWWARRRVGGSSEDVWEMRR